MHSVDSDRLTVPLGKINLDFEGWHGRSCDIVPNSNQSRNQTLLSMTHVLEEFRNKCILVVEDDYLLAEETRRQLEASGAQVIGPVPRVDQALSLIDNNEIDAAILDVRLDAETSYPIAATLEARSIPFVFATAFSTEDMPEAYRGFVVEKPASLQAIGQKLFGSRPH